MGKIALVIAICLSPFLMNTRASIRHVPPWVKFDEYSEISDKAQQQRVKNFVFQLRATRGSVAVIVASGGAKSCPDEAKQRAARVRQLLLRSGIDAHSIRVVDAGYEKQWTIALFLGPRDAPPITAESLRSSH